jgi:hypothetical protein
MAINSRDATNCRTAEDHVISRDARSIACKRGMLATGKTQERARTPTVAGTPVTEWTSAIAGTLSTVGTLATAGSPCREQASARISATAGSRAASKTTVPEIIDTVFAKTSPKRSFSMTEYERFRLVFTKTRVYKFGHRNV